MKTPLDKNEIEYGCTMRWCVDGQGICEHCSHSYIKKKGYRAIITEFGIDFIKEK